MRIFVSYSRANKTEVKNIVDLLKLEYEVFWDADITSMSIWWAKILEEIEKCDIFIFVISEESVRSEYCLAEFDYARARNRPILPVVIDASVQHLIPDNLRAIQSFTYDKDQPADLILKLRNPIEQIDWNQYRDIQVQRPPVPTSSEKSIIERFQKAVKLAKSREFDKAKDIFAEVKGLDFQRWGRKCIKWMKRINAYDEIRQLAVDESTRREAIIK